MLIVVVVAIVAAVQFRKAGSQPKGSGEWIGGGLERRLSAEDSEGWSGRFASAPLKTEPLRVPTASTDFVSDGPSVAPDLPSRYHRTFSPVGALLNAEERPEADEPSLLNDNAASNGARALTHKIADGDTLTSLAEKYLGNAARWQELFKHNQDVLKNPDLLPIGRVIRIPQGPPEPKPEKLDAVSAPPMTPIPRGAFRQGEF